MHPTRELSEIARQFRHLQAEHEREGVEGSWRRRQGARLAELERHFETLLERWVDEPTERDRWREHFYRGGSRPEPSVAEQLIFRGRSPEGGLLEVRENDAGERAVLIDGTRADHSAAHPPIKSPPRFGKTFFEETFELPAEAVEALSGFLRGTSREPPWRWAPVLHADGIIDATFALTERGRRLMRGASH